MAMRTGIAALVLLSLACVVRADDGPTPAPTAPGLEVPEPVYDAGTVERGVTLRHAFALKNIGQAQLSNNAKPGPGCTVTVFDKVIPPHEAGEVTTSLNTSRYKGCSA